MVLMVHRVGPTCILGQHQVLPHDDSDDISVEHVEPLAPLCALDYPGPKPSTYATVQVSTTGYEPRHRGVTCVNTMT